MNRLAIAVLLFATACSKKSDVPAPAAKAKGQTVSANPTITLPPAGTAPPPVTVDKEIPMWNAPIKTLKGQETKLADFRGKALMLVNVASKCGNTPQYTALEALQKKYGPQGFTVIGFPCNQFGGQEPGTAKEIEEFCSTTYGVTFPLMEKIDVNGPNRHEIYKTLTPLKDASGHDGNVRWNFEKFVVSADGTQITRFDPKTTPDDPAVIAAVEQALAKK